MQIKNWEHKDEVSAHLLVLLQNMKVDVLLGLPAEKQAMFTLGQLWREENLESLVRFASHDFPLCRIENETLFCRINGGWLTKGCRWRAESNSWNESMLCWEMLIKRKKKISRHWCIIQRTLRFVGPPTFHADQILAPPEFEAGFTLVICFATLGTTSTRCEIDSYVTVRKNLERGCTCHSQAHNHWEQRL